MGKQKKQTLLIVESPAKARTIERYLGDGYTVAASMGHLIDLPKSRLAIDIEKGYEPEYITVRGKAKILKELQKQANKAEEVLLASDNDREGEAIAFQLKKVFEKKNDTLPIKRISFNEITPQAIREAVDHPTEVDINKVNAQKARRVLDRLVGYNLSPLLWKKVKNGLSAGRVQSVALRLICEREKEVESFIPEEYWTLEALLAKDRHEFSAQMVLWEGEKPALKNEEAAAACLKELEGKTCTLEDLRMTRRQVNPKPPYTTSKLQQDAANRLAFTSRKTMQIAQQLYEGIALGSSRVGLITYMRTDSTRVSKGALEDARSFIGKTWPDSLPEKANLYSAGKGAQDAHEAIRPTYVTNTPDSVKEYLNRDQLKLYSIIWERFVASQMVQAVAATETLDLKIGKGIFRVSATRYEVKGFRKALKLLKSKEQTQKIPSMKTGDSLKVLGFTPEQHFTSGPSRYTDASIVKTLEEKGIGRPSTYAPIISVLLDRYYVVRKTRQLVPTTLGRIISDILVQSFPDIVNVDFTVKMEQKLDAVEDNRVEWHHMVDEFYRPLKDQVDHVEATLESVKGILDEPTDFVCEECGRPMVKRLGRYGFFLACSGFPECRNTKPIPLADCPRPGCDGKIVARKKQGGRGKEFYGCTNYPACDFITHYKPTSMKCPKCGYFLVEKTDKKRGNHKECINPDCDFLHTAGAEEDED
ncbi:MAG: type I DNA topoisomerase [Spirochaetales bacterium]|nr:type I DNA topoisomerase [Spirochaetales bacterium]